jgi:hypothetical protein
MGIETVFARSPSRWASENIRHWLEEDRVRDNFDRPRLDPSSGPGGRSYEPAYCDRDVPRQQCPRPSAIKRDCEQAAREPQEAWDAFCGMLARYNKVKAAECRDLNFMPAMVKYNWCSWNFGRKP